MKLISDLRAKALEKYGYSGNRSVLKAALSDGSVAMVSYRAMQWSQRHRLTPLAMFWNKFGAFFGQCLIGRRATFGDRFVLLHSQGVVINSSVRGGDDVYLEHQVTLGATARGAPVIGNNVRIGCGAKVLGPISVGDGVTIGANAVVVKDVPAGVTVGGIPARILGSSSRDAAELPPEKG